MACFKFTFKRLSTLVNVTVENNREDTINTIFLLFSGKEEKIKNVTIHANPLAG